MFKSPFAIPFLRLQKYFIIACVCVFLLKKAVATYFHDHISKEVKQTSYIFQVIKIECTLSGVLLKETQGKNKWVRRGMCRKPQGMAVLSRFEVATHHSIE